MSSKTNIVTFTFDFVTFKKECVNQQAENFLF